MEAEAAMMMPLQQVCPGTLWPVVQLFSDLAQAALGKLANDSNFKPYSSAYLQVFSLVFSGRGV